MSRKLTVALPMILGMAAFAGADDWPQWLGPNQAATLNERGIVTSIPAAGLPVKWRAECGLGYSGPAVVDGKVFLTDYVVREGEIQNSPSGRTSLQGSERVRCYSVDLGQLLWMHEDDTPYNVSYAAGPRATPTVNDGHVYTLGAEGRLLCLAAGDGSVVWQHELKPEYGVESPLWGFSASVLIDGDLAIVMVGGDGHAVVAFDKRTGAEKWRALSAADAGYSTPTIIEQAGQRQLIAWLPTQIHSLDPASGKVYWSVNLKPDYGMSIMTPRIEGNRLFASGIGNVGAVLNLAEDTPAAKVGWTGKGTTAMYCANSTPLIEQGIIYGVDCRTGHLVAARLSNGERLWESKDPTIGKDERRGSHGTAYLVKHGEWHFIFSETGDLILAKLSAEKYEELGRFHLLDPTNECFGRPVVWSHPAFADRHVFARNDRELVCVSIAAE
ncbi:MAG: PQQ-binding-like beta-propeller repeat protein [Planctomycetaceae bacterium]